MSKRAASQRHQKTISNIVINGVLILICLIWIVPTLGILVTSFRQSEKIFQSGWWTVFPHRGFVQTREINIDPTTDVNAGQSH